MFDLDISEVDDVAGVDRPSSTGPPPGGYTFIVQDVDLGNPDQSIKVLLEVACGEYEGRTHYLFLSKGGWGARFTMLFALAAEILTQEELDKAEQAKRDGGKETLALDLESAIGKLIKAEVEKVPKRQNTGKKDDAGKEIWEDIPGEFQNKIKYRMYRMDDSRGADIPSPDDAPDASLDDLD